VVDDSTENATVVTDLLVNLRDRGLDVTRPLLVVIDGAKALASAALPLMLKVEEAARVPRIGRTLAYELASRFEAGDCTGLPVVRLGVLLRVPRWALAEVDPPRPRHE
jgi:NADPH-dependent 2,4-dienoyl-CoA reductase/sulfur reductase-like enzyme